MALKYSGYQQGKTGEGRPLEGLDLEPLGNIASNLKGKFGYGEGQWAPGKLAASMLGGAWNKLTPDKDAYYDANDREGFSDEERDNMNEMEWDQFGSQMMGDRKKSGFKGLMQRVMPWGKTGYEEAGGYNAQNLKDMHGAITSGSDRIDMLRTDRITPDMIQDMYNANAIDKETFDLYNNQDAGVNDSIETRKKLGINELGDGVEKIGEEEETDLPFGGMANWYRNSWLNPFDI